MTIGYQGAKQALISPSFYTPGRPLGPPRWIFIHGTASSTGYKAEETARDFGSSVWQATRHADTHYIVGYDGTVVQTVGEENTAWGNGIITGPPGRAPMGGGAQGAPHDAWWDTTAKRSVNEYSISIEHSKSVDNKSALSPEQQAASFALINDICNRWHIPKKYADASGGITGHYSVDPINRAYCPGTYPWNELFSFLADPNNFSPTLPVPVIGDPTVGNGPGPESPARTEPGGFTLAPISITHANNAYLALSDRTHEVLQSTPGFYGMVSALDESFQFPGIYNAFSGDNNPMDAPANTTMSVLGTMNANGTPLFLRVVVIGVGLALLYGLYKQAATPLSDILGGPNDQ